MDLVVDRDVPAADLHAGTITLAPRARVRLHWHEVGELQFVLAGTGLLLGPEGSTEWIGPGTAVYSPRGRAAAHGFANTGRGDLIILFAYGSDDGSGPEVFEVEPGESPVWPHRFR